MIVEATIEIPMGSQNKYEIDSDTGKIKLDRVLYSSSHYPAEYGYIDNTLSEDGDHMDILVFTSAPTFPGCCIDARVIGGIYMIDSGEEDIKLLSVNVGDPRYQHIKKIEDLGPHIVRELENFFSTYKTLQGKETKVTEIFDENKAIQYLNKAKEKYLMSINN